MRFFQRKGIPSGWTGVFVVLGILLGVPRGMAEPWKPAPGPLLTRWTKQVSPENVLPEYPRPQMVRPRWQNLNGLWQLAAAQEDQLAPTGHDLPGTILVPFPVESALSGVMRPAERVWYRRTFHVPQSWFEGRVLLHFQAVDWETTVHVNSQQLAVHQGGYDAFSVDITEALHEEPGAEQELIVHVFDPTDQGNQARGKQVLKPQGARYTATTGIWQTVWLEPVPAARIERLKLTPDVDGSCLRVTVWGEGTWAAHAIEVVARDGDTEVGRAYGGLGAEITLPIPREKRKLWSPESPHLYDLSVTLLEGTRQVDEISSYFGLRKIDVARDEKGIPRIRLNGKPLVQIGLLDQGYWPDGLYTAPTDEALRYDIETAKRLGFSLLRKHVKVEPGRWYYWCDRLGMLVWQDMPNGNNQTDASRQQFERELHRMVQGLENHPSIIMWVVFNEGWGQHDTERYVSWIKQADPGRLVNGASGWKDCGVGDVVDVHQYPGPAAPKPESRRAGVLGEYGGLKLVVRGHTWPKPAWGYRNVASANELTRRYVDLMRQVWELSDSQGLAAAVYTQLTDVESECNGLMTYDRAVIKVDENEVPAANGNRFLEGKR